MTLARTLKAEVLLLRVAKARGFPGTDQTEAQGRSVVREAEGFLAGMVARLSLRGLPARTTLRSGEAVAATFDHIRSADVGPVAMASRGRTA